MERNYAEEDKLNNLLATGAILAGLMAATKQGVTFQGVRPIYDEQGQATNQIEFEVDFLKSPYRITVERFDPPF